MANLSSVITQTVGTSVAGVNLITSPNSSEIFTVTTISKSTTTTAAELPLGPAIATATKFTLAGSAGTAYVDFDCPAALLNTKLSLGWFAESSASFTAAITLTLSSYATSGERTANTTPTSISLQTSTVQGMAPSFFTSFDTNSEQYYRLTIAFGAQVGAWYSVCQVQVGPGEKYQSAAIGEWQSYTLTATGSSGNPTVTYSVRTGQWRRVGSTMEIRGQFLPSAYSGGSGDFQFDVPSGYSIDFSLISTAGIYTVMGSGAWFNGTTTSMLSVGISSSRAGKIYFSKQGGQTLASGDIAANHQVGFECRIPIAEWSSSTLVHGAGAQVEYAATSGTWNADSSTTVYGPGGQLVGGALTIGRVKTITWQYPIQTDDVITVEGSIDQITWTPMNMMAITGGVIIPAMNSDATVMAGVACGNLSATQTKVVFGRYIQIANDDSPVYDWPASGLYWRCRKSKSSAPVGFGMANSNDSGLIKPRKGQYALTFNTTPAGWNVIRARGLYYQDQDGNHRFKFNIIASVTSASSISFNIDGVTFKNLGGGFAQAICVQAVGSAPYTGSGGCNSNNSVINCYASSSAADWRLSGDVELESKPTWA